MTDYTVRPLSGATWTDFSRLVERHDGVWGGCWCTAFHADGVGRTKTAEQNRTEKEALVKEGRAHAALVYDGPECVGWCQFGPTAELPRIKQLRAYLAGIGAGSPRAEGSGGLPDWRITCFFVDRAYHRRGVASVALGGALREIARLGGGTVESYPENTAGRSVSASSLHNGSLALFERHGFARDRPLGRHHWVVARQVPSA